MMSEHTPNRIYLPKLTLCIIGYILSICGIFRSALWAFFNSRLVDVNFVKLLINGAHTDLVIASFITLPVVFLAGLLPQSWLQKSTKSLSIYLALILTLMVFLETASFNFISQYDIRPNRIFYEYLIYPKEVLTTLIKGAPLAMFLMFVELLILPWIFMRIFQHHLKLPAKSSYRYRIAFAPLLILALVIGARGTLSKRPFNFSSVAFSPNRLANELALNSLYSVIYSLYRERKEVDPQKLYGKIDISRAISILQKRLGPEGTFQNPKRPFERWQTLASPNPQPPNVVFFLQESLGAEYVGHLGGLPLTPHLDALANEGLYFSQMFSVGTRTVRGIEGIIASFLPTPGPSVVKLEKAKSGFSTAAQMFKDNGYTTEFIYGGDSNFDEMKSFFIGNGVDHFYDEPTFTNPVFTNEWGVSDEDLIKKANEVFKSHGAKPFFAIMLSTTSHHPFEFPDGRIELYEKPKNTFNNAAKYADFAIGELFRLARKEEYFKNTIFVVIADHSTRVFGAEYVPIKKFHIPAVIVGPGVPKLKYEKPASQVDILPTVLALTGLNTKFSSLGRNVLSLPATDPGRAVMQYHNNFGYLIGDQLTVLQPNLPPTYFVMKDFKLVPSQKPFSFTDEALATLVLPWFLYDRQMY